MGVFKTLCLDGTMDEWLTDIEEANVPNAWAELLDFAPRYKVYVTQQVRLESHEGRGASGKGMVNLRQGHSVLTW